MTGEAGELAALREGCAELGVELAPSQQEQILRYLDLLYVWNRSAGLTTIARTDAVRLHLLDSLAALEDVRVGPCVDLGTGGGLPGLVLAISKPSIDFVLVESNRRKCSFLLEAVRVAGLSNARVVESDYERLTSAGEFPTVISRAFRPPPEFLAIASRFVSADGRIVLLLADPPDEELAGLARPGLELDSSRRFRLPGGGEPRTIAVFRKS